MTLYSKNGSYPAPLPPRIRLSDGFTRTDPAQYTEEDIVSAGYVVVPNPPEYNPNTQALDWTGSEWLVVTAEPVMNGTVGV